jgi:predicted O-linked N-acetylglucosamine transferase (SPINDLY family)
MTNEHLEQTNSSATLKLSEALAVHQHGKLKDADFMYRQILKIDPKNADCHHLLGVIAHQTGQHHLAVEMICRAIEINPNISSYYSNLGNALREIKQLNASIASYNKAIVLKPDYAEAYYNRGISLQELKQLEAAVASFGKALEFRPDLVDAYFNRANALKELNQLQAAITNYDKAIALQPDLADAYSNKGTAQKDLGQLQAAVASYDRAIELKPYFAEALYNRGNAFKELNQFENALRSYDAAIALKPGLAEAYCNRGNTLKELFLLEAAVESYDKAIALRPELAEAYYNRGISLHELKRLDAAVASYDKAIILNPEYADAYCNRGITLQELKQLNAAVASYDKAIALNPDFAEAYSNRGNALQELKRFEDAVASYDKAIKLKPDFEYLFGVKLHSQMSLCNWQNFAPSVLELKNKIQNKDKASTPFCTQAFVNSLADQLLITETWSKNKYPLNQSLGFKKKSRWASKIRIGYYSSDFRLHPVSILIAGLFEKHDKSKFELIAFSFGPNIQDDISNRIISAFDKFIDVRKKSDKEVAELSRKLDIDIGIDLGGYTQDSRTGIFSFRAAPIQLSYIGYLGTMGANYYDYLIADSILIPKEYQPFYSEKIVYLPTYQVNDDKQEIPRVALSRQELKLPNTGFVYCCFNANYKITPFTFDRWMKILKAVPDSVLLLYTDIQTVAKNLKLEAVKRGVNPERLIFGEKLIRSQYLARCKSADLFLDTFPYNAGATASDALWAGLPVLTCIGEVFASRYAASLLHAVGLPELVTETQAEYENLAIELGTNPYKLKAIKDKLEINRMTAPLFDTAQFTKHIETAYTNMYQRYQMELPPAHIYVGTQSLAG